MSESSFALADCVCGRLSRDIIWVFSQKCSPAASPIATDAPDIDLCAAEEEDRYYGLLTCRVLVVVPIISVEKHSKAINWIIQCRTEDEEQQMRRTRERKGRFKENKNRLLVILLPFLLLDKVNSESFLSSPGCLV